MHRVRGPLGGPLGDFLEYNIRVPCVMDEISNVIYDF